MESKTAQNIIPRNWKTVEFSKIVDLLGGSTPDTTNYNYWNGDIHWLTPKDITKDTEVHVKKTNRKITELGLEKGPRVLHPIGCVLMTSRAPVGIPVINDVPMAVNQGFIVIYCKLVDIHFMFYWIKNNIEFLKRVSNGTTFLELSKRTLKTLEISRYLSSGFKVRFLTEESSSSEDVGIDNVVINVDSVTECILTVQSTLQSSSAIRTSWNDCGDDVDRYYVYVSRDGGADRLYRVTPDTEYTLQSTIEGSSYVFKVKARYTEDRTFTEKFSGNTVSVPIVDRTAPIVTVPNNLTIDAISPNGATHNYTVTGYDTIDGIVSVSCTPVSGALFSVGSTTVTCTASDDAENRVTETFTVTVNVYVPPDADNDGFADSIDECPTEASLVNNGCPLIPVIPTNSTTIVPTNSTTPITFYGGDRIRMIQNVTTGPIPQIDDGTITIGAIKIDGQVGFVTAGHVVRESTYGHTVSLDGYYLGLDNLKVYSTNPEIIVEGNKDVGFVPITGHDNFVVSTNELKKRDGTIIDVETDSVISIVADLVIQLVGIHHNSESLVLYTNATVNMSTADIVLSNMGISDYASTGGDSGGAIITSQNGTNYLVGIHKGFACEITDYSVAGIMHIDVRKNSICLPGYTNYTSFTHWDNAKNALQLQ